MASRSSTGSFLAAFLAFIAVLAVFAGKSACVMGQSDGASISIVIGSPTVAGYWVHCYDNEDTDLPLTNLHPGQTFYHTWIPEPLVADVYTCDFEVDGGVTPTKASFQVWKHDQADPRDFLNECSDCKWMIKADGFYWYSDRQANWVRKNLWT